MANYIGPVVLEAIRAFVREDNTVTLSGWFTSRGKLDGLAELFRRAPEGSAINTVLGGIQKGFDLTSDNRLTQYCLFDDERLVDGWYLLRRFRYEPRQDTSAVYPFMVEMFFLGTSAEYQPGYDIQDLEEVENDWGI